MATETGASGQPRSKPSDSAVRAQLDRIYQDLTDSGVVLVAL